MKFIQYEQMGNPATVLSLHEQSDRALGASEARVAVLATPIHPSNLLQIAGVRLVPEGAA